MHATLRNLPALLATLALTGFGGCLTALNGGCSETPTAEKIALFEQVSIFARENDMAGTVSLTVGGDGSVYAKQSFGLDANITVQASLLFNAADVDPAIAGETTNAPD
jgi:hypothetical protein